MKEAVGAFAAKTHFAQLLDRVERGERITIHRRGRPVAELVPVVESKMRPWGEILADLDQVRRANQVPRGYIRRSIHAGHKY